MAITNNGTASFDLPDVSVTAPATPPQAPVIAPTAQSPYAVRRINVTFQLGTGNFGQSGANTLALGNLRVFVHLENVVSPHMGSTLVMRVYGMTLDHMNALSRAGLLYGGYMNSVTVQAGDDVVGMATVFTGTIIEAYPDFESADPRQRFFYVSAQGTGSAIRFQPIAPASFPGPTSAAQQLQQVCGAAGINFQNNGVSAVLSPSYYPGTAWQQIGAIVRAANCNAHYYGVSNTLSVWPKTPPAAGSAGSTTLIISPQTGMVGYPKFQQNTIIVRVLFSPTTAITPGTKVLIQSSLAAANNALIQANIIMFDLESQLPGGPWEATIEGVSASAAGAS